MVVVGEASGYHGPDLQHGSCGHTPPQAPQWDPLGHHYNTGGPLRVGQHALLQATPQGLHLGHARHAHDSTTSLAAQRQVLHDDFCEIPSPFAFNGDTLALPQFSALMVEGGSYLF